MRGNLFSKFESFDALACSHLSLSVTLAFRFIEIRLASLHGHSRGLRRRHRASSSIVDLASENSSGVLAPASVLPFGVLRLVLESASPRVIHPSYSSCRVVSRFLLPVGEPLQDAGMSPPRPVLSPPSLLPNVAVRKFDVGRPRRSLYGGVRAILCYRTSRTSFLPYRVLWFSPIGCSGNHTISPRVLVYQHPKYARPSHSEMGVEISLSLSALRV